MSNYDLVAAQALEKLWMMEYNLEVALFTEFGIGEDVRMMGALGMPNYLSDAQLFVLCIEVEKSVNAKGQMLSLLRSRPSVTDDVRNPLAQQVIDRYRQTRKNLESMQDIVEGL